MFKTKVVKGMPEEVKEKRRLRIKEAINFPTGTKEKPTHNVIDTINGTEVYMDKPGKEYFRENSRNINDMAPGVGNYYERYSFSDVWRDLLNISIQLSEESYKKLYVIIYRLAYMLDCKIEDNKVRFKPDLEITNEIEKIQLEIDSKKLDFKLLEFLNFLDVVGWNEDVKYQSEMTFIQPKNGRINNILSMISIPLFFKKFVDNVMANKDDLKKVDYSELINMAQDFSRTRGILPISNVKLVEHLTPYLILKDGQ